MTAWQTARRTPYTERGITRLKCIRCRSPARFQWQVCADKRIFRPLCTACDIALNRLVLRWAGDPQWKPKCERYAKAKRVAE